MSNFFTIEKNTAAEIKEKGSKFIGLAFPVSTEEEVKNILNLLRKQYYDATHHCYAYILGADKKNYRANDDGEPNNSAGNPILGAIKSKNITNTLVVVVRYYGGTKLGVGGLISAYKMAATLALNEARIIEDFEYETLKIVFDIEAMNEIMNLIKKYDVKITEQNYHTQYEFNLLFKSMFKTELIDKFSHIKTLETVK
jgi:uncharacterized YigZ family protein